MTRPLLLVFATRYDAVTRRSCAIAQRLLAEVQGLGISSVALIETAATAPRFVDAVANRSTAIAFYCHGDSEGRILTQDREPCWTGDRIPGLSGTAVFAHACRAMRWLSDQALALQARLLAGYECDLMTPTNGSDQFWEMYESVHCFVARHLAAGSEDTWIRREFYELCTKYVHELNARSAGLIEIIAVQQSRDEIVFL